MSASESGSSLTNNSPVLPVEDAGERFEVAGDHGSSGSHGLQQHDAETLTAGVGATYTSALAKALILSASVTSPETHSIPQVGREVLSGLLLVAGASDQHLDARMRRGDPGQGGQQHVQTFARLVDTTDEEQRRVLSRVAGKR